MIQTGVSDSCVLFCFLSSAISTISFKKNSEAQTSDGLCTWIGRWAEGWRIWVEPGEVNLVLLRMSLICLWGAMTQPGDFRSERVSVQREKISSSDRHRTDTSPLLHSIGQTSHIAEWKGVKSCMINGWMDTGVPGSVYLKKKFFLSSLCTQYGAGTHDPKINSCMLCWLHQPGAPVWRVISREELDLEHLIIFILHFLFADDTFHLMLFECGTCSSVSHWELSLG